MRGSSLFLTVTIFIAGVLLFLFALATVVPGPAPDKGPSDEIVVGSLDAPTVDFANPMIGPIDAPVRVVEFGDFQCESCAAFHSVITQALLEYGNAINYVWKDAPDPSVHPYAVAAAAAARCAGEQGAYWPYHSLMFANQASINDNAWVPFATELELDTGNFSECMDANRMAPAVERDKEQAIRLGIDGTPFIFVNDVRVSGSVTIDKLRSLVDTELRKAGIEPPSHDAAPPAPVAAPSAANTAPSAGNATPPSPDATAAPVADTP